MNIALTCYWRSMEMWHPVPPSTNTDYLIVIVPVAHLDPECLVGWVEVGLAPVPLCQGSVHQAGVTVLSDGAAWANTMSWYHLEFIVNPPHQVLPQPSPNKFKNPISPKGTGADTQIPSCFPCFISQKSWSMSLVRSQMMLVTNLATSWGWAGEATGLVAASWRPHLMGLGSADPAQINTRAIMRHLMTTCLGDMSLKVYTWYFDKVLKVNWDYSLLEIVCCHVLCIPSLLTYIFSSSFHSPPVSFINTIGKFG